VAGSSEHDSETSGLIIGGEFRDQLKNYGLMKKNYAPCG
jgi:hypothetical protein